MGSDEVFPYFAKDEPKRNSSDDYEEPICHIDVIMDQIYQEGGVNSNNNKIQMTSRFMQEDKFKNISIKLEPLKAPSPDLQTSNIVKPTHSPTNRPATPIHSRNYLPKENGKSDTPLASSHLYTRTYEMSNNQTPFDALRKGREIDDYGRKESVKVMISEIKDIDQALVSKLQAQIGQKEQIIAELKSIIRISHQNTNRSKIKSGNFEDKSPKSQRANDEEQRQLKQLRHTVRILTIQNSTLSDYIDKMKKQSQYKFDSQDTQQISGKQKGLMKQQKDDLSAQIYRLNQIIRQKQCYFQKKIDEFIVSHKSLAHECQRIQEEKVLAEQLCKRAELQKQQIQSQNKRLIILLQEIQQVQRRGGNRQQDRLLKNGSSQKYAIQKIKQQYAQSLQQFKATVSYQTQYLFDQFRFRLQEMSKKVVNSQQKLHKVESALSYLRQSYGESSKRSKKSQIYIEEGVESSSASDSQIDKSKPNDSQYREKPFAVSRIIDSNLTSKFFDSQQLIKSHQEQIAKLKGIITDLQNQISNRQNYYTFRDKQFENSQIQIDSYKIELIKKDEQLTILRKERENSENLLLSQIETLKKEIQRVQRAYKKQKSQSNLQNMNELLNKDKIISQLQVKALRIQYQYEENVRKYQEFTKVQHQLQQENQNLKEQLKDCIQRIQRYKTLLILMKEQSNEVTINIHIFNELKEKINQIQQKYFNQFAVNSRLLRQIHQFSVANKQLKLKLEESLHNYNRIFQISEKERDKNRILEKSKEELVQKITYLERLMKMMEEEIKRRKQTQQILLSEKRNLEKQIIDNLSFFNKSSESGSDRKGADSIDIESLLKKLQTLQSSVRELSTARHEKKERIATIISQEFSHIQERDISCGLNKG